MRPCSSLLTILPLPSPPQYPHSSSAPCIGPKFRIPHSSRHSSLLHLRRSRAPEDEVHRSHQAPRRPQVIQLRRLLHVVHRKRHEDPDRNHFLQNLQLPEREHRVSDAIRRHLQHVLEQRDSPARERRDVPGACVQVLEMGVPRERHEEIREDQQSCGSKNDRHVSPWWMGVRRSASISAGTSCTWPCSPAPVVPLAKRRNRGNSTSRGRISCAPVAACPRSYPRPGRGESRGSRPHLTPHFILGSTMTRRLILVLLCIIAAGAQASAQSMTTVVILVRHAEKAAAPAADPPPTEAGVARARALATALAEANVRAVITTELIRTRETARPLADGLGLPLETLPTGLLGVHAKAVADAVRAHAGQT